MPIFRVKSIKNLHRAKKIYTGTARGACDKYHVWREYLAFKLFSSKKKSNRPISIFRAHWLGIRVSRFLFRSARTSCTTSDWPARPQEKSGSLKYRHTCLMNHQKSHQPTRWCQSGSPLSCPLSSRTFLGLFFLVTSVYGWPIFFFKFGRFWIPRTAVPPNTYVYGVCERSQAL